MDNELKKSAQKLKDKLSKIKVCLFDVDGVLTDGTIWYEGQEMGWNRTTHARDGYMLKELMRQGFKVGVVTGGDSRSVKERYEINLKLDYVYSGREDKRWALLDILKNGYKLEEVLYMGDEFFDLPILKVVGFSATTSEASLEIQEQVDYVARVPAGKGCAREVMDLLRYAQGIDPKVPYFEEGDLKEFL